MRTQGIVVAADEQRATVRFERTAACKNCGGCMAFGEKQAQVEVANSLGAKVGDTVEVSLHEGGVAKASLLAYGIPLIGLLAGMFLGSLISEAVAFAGAIVFALAGFFVLKLLNRRFTRIGSFQPYMIRIVQ